MILVLASAADDAAAAFAREFGAARAAVLTCLDIAREPCHVLDPGFEGSSIGVGGETIPVAQIEGVINLLPAVFPDELLPYAEEEREYQAAEFHALLTFFLSALKCLVINRPTPLSLNGPALNPLGWHYLAREAGIPLAGVDIDSNEFRNPFSLKEEDILEVVCVGGCVSTPSGTDADGYTRSLASLAGVGFLKARYRRDGRTGARLVAADSVPDVRLEETRLALKACWRA